MMRKLLTAFKHAWYVFISYYHKFPSDEITADLYEAHLKARKRNPRFKEQLDYTSGQIKLAYNQNLNGWLNKNIPVIVPQNVVWSVIEQVKSGDEFNE
jgi:hypothetical protein